MPACISPKRKQLPSSLWEDNSSPWHPRHAIICYQHPGGAGSFLPNAPPQNIEAARQSYNHSPPSIETGQQPGVTDICRRAKHKTKESRPEEQQASRKRPHIAIHADIHNIDNGQTGNVLSSWKKPTVSFFREKQKKECANPFIHYERISAWNHAKCDLRPTHAAASQSPEIFHIPYRLLSSHSFWSYRPEHFTLHTVLSLIPDDTKVRRGLQKECYYNVIVRLTLR